MTHTRRLNPAKFEKHASSRVESIARPYCCVQPSRLTAVKDRDGGIEISPRRGGQDGDILRRM